MTMKDLRRSLGGSPHPNPVRVVARIRPLNEVEKARDDALCVNPILSRSELDTRSSTAMTSEERLAPKTAPSATRIGSPIRQARRNPLAFLTPDRKKKTSSHTPRSPRNPTNETPVRRNFSAKKLLFAHKLPPQPQAPVVETYGTASSLLSGKMDTSLKQFDFDVVIPAEASQKQVYDRSVGDAIKSNLLKGYNTTIMAYGQSASGKTYTMTGEEENQGIIPRAVDDLFRAIKSQPTGSVEVFLTNMEIYQDEIFDLLAEEDKGPLRLRDQGREIMISGLTSLRVTTASQVQTVLDASTRRRRKASTFLNVASSRSHAICTLSVAVQSVASGSSDVISAKLTLVDLAGSERIKQSGVVGLAQQETININKDLFVLSKVVAALAEKSKKKHVHVPYRDSKLTRILRDSLGGNCFTVMIACVSPSTNALDESVNTLRYAENARSITNTVKPNVVKPPLTLAESTAMRRENKLLKSKVLELRRRVHVLESAAKRSAGDDDTNYWKLQYDTLLAMSKGQRDIDEDLDDEISLDLSVDTVAAEREEKIRKLDEEIKVKRSLLGAMEERVLARRLEVAKESSQLKESMQLMSNEFNSLQNRLLRSHESSGRPEKREIELSSFPVCQEDTSKKLKKAESEIDKLKSALVDSTRRLVILDERDEEQKSDVQELEARVEKEETRCRGLEREVEGHKAEKAELEHIRDKLQIQAAVKDDEINRLRDSVQKSAEECLELRQSLQRANSAIDAIGNSKDGKENFADSDAKPKGRPPRPRRVLRENQQSSSKKTIMSSPSNTEKALDALDSQSDADPVFESFDDSTIASDSLNSVSSSPKSIRIQAAKMLVWANKAIEKGRGGKSTCSSAGSSNGTELKPNTKDLQVETAAASKPAPSTPVGKPPRGSTKGKRLFQIETSPIVISNMEEVQTPCACQGPMFSGNKDQVEFYLPQLGVACTCGKHKTNRNLNSANATDLTNILRPWQVKFLESLDITMAEQLVIAYSSQGSRLARDMRKWRKKKRLRSVKTKSCEIALHIWARTCRTVVKSVHAQQATGAKVVKKPEFLEISLTSADNRTISTLGGGSFTSFADSVSVAEF